MKNKLFFNLGKMVAVMAPIFPLYNVLGQQKPMNVIYIMSDDHTSQAIGVYGSRLATLNPTPNIDKLAKDGMIFKNCFCTNSISTPSRACIITGQYSHHNSVLTLDNELRPDQEYLPEEMHKLGYQTAMIGKWHLKCEPSKFDYYAVFNGHGGQGEYFDPTFLSNGVKDKNWPKNLIKTKGYSSDIVTNLSLDWLKHRRDKSKPFFLMHHYKAPHDMFEYAPRYEDSLEDVEIPVPESLYNQDKWGSVGTRGYNDNLRDVIGSSVSSRNKYRNYVTEYKCNTGDPKKDTYLAYQEYLKRYLRCVKGVDDNLKRLFDYLKKEGLWDNTIIVYTGDQGMMLGEHDLIDKRWMYDESERMPFIVRDPRSHYRGEKSDLLINNVDFAPTLLELVGLKNTPAYMDGKSFASVFDGKNPDHWKDALYYRYWMHLIHHNVPAHIGIRTKDYKLILFYGMHYDPSRNGKPSMPPLKDKSYKIQPTPVSFELYDVNNDPNEMVNLADNPKYKKVFKEMKKKLHDLRISVGDTDEKYPELKKVIDKALK